MLSRLILLLLATTSAWADTKVGFIEAFALAPDRETVLALLVPGTEEYYFYHALHYQNTTQQPKLDAILKQWAARFPQSTQRRIIENRAALLTWDADPQATLQFLRDRLQLRFDDEREAIDEPPALPTVLDPAAITFEVFQQEALQSEDLSTVTPAGLAELVRRKVPLDPARQRALLARFERPDVEGLLEIVIADLKRPESKGFGEFPIHRALLPAQLDALAKQVPTVLESWTFVEARLAKMAPGPEIDLDQDTAERAAWLDRLSAYTRNLSGNYNHLRTLILYRQLDHDRQAGLYNRARFLEYLKLPRRFPYVNEQWLARPEVANRAITLDAEEVAKALLIQPLPTDEPLVRDYLLHLLRDEPKPDAFAPYLRDTFLLPLFAEAKLLHGLGTTDQWAALLAPAQMKALRDRVDLDFAPTNTRTHAPGDAVKLALEVKNVPALAVRIYELNALGYFLTEKKQLNTDLNVDGLVANVQRVLPFDDAAGKNPFRRVRREYALPELAGKRGAWIVEFIGGGKSSRALVRKGQWEVLPRIGPAGDELRVIDEARQPVKGAVAWVDGRRYDADAETALITIPFAAQTGEKPVVLTDAAGDFATLTNFIHHAEEYRLEARLHLEREQILSRREATIAVRAALTVAGRAIPIGLLTDVRLRITAETLDGISTTTEVPGVVLPESGLFTHRFPVPDRLKSLTAELTGKVERLAAGGEKKDLAASETWRLNGIDATENPGAGHLSKMGDDYVYELLGRNGEPLRDKAVAFCFGRADFLNQVELSLRTDERGRIRLGLLAEIVLVNEEREGRHNHWNLLRGMVNETATIHARVGETIYLPWMGVPGPLTRVAASLLETRGGAFTEDRFAAMALAQGMLEIKGLPAGEYSLDLAHGGEPIKLQVAEGQPVDGWLLSANHSLEQQPAPPVGLVALDMAPDAVTIRLRHLTALTRVHVVATRFLPDAQSLGTFTQFERPTPASLRPAKRPALYHAGRNIGDEYRYILDRRNGRPFPGNMLTRPGLLLQPWELRETGLDQQAIVAGEAAQASGGDVDSRRGAEFKLQGEGTGSAGKASGDPVADTSPSLNFLATAAPVLHNLVPDAQGVVRIDRKLLGDRQHVQILVEDAQSAQWHTFALPEAATAFRDLRLTQGLDPAKALVESRESILLKTGETLTLPGLLADDVALYDSLSSAHALLAALLKDPASRERLPRFEWLLRWPKLSEEERRAKYSEFACHEVNFFLSRKDPEFFKAVILPHLRNKKEPGFMDEYLTGVDLSRHVEPWHYARLNAVEAALLARRLPAETAATARHLRELWDLLPPNPGREDQLFESALRGQALASEDEETSENNIPASAAFGDAAGLGGSSLAMFAESPASPAPAQLAPARATKGMDSLLALKDESFARLRESVAKRKVVRALFRSLGPAKEWAENRYYLLPLAAQGPELIGVNPFWRDYAAWNGEGAFTSPNLPEAHTNLAEVLLALAVLDLPFEAGKHARKLDDRQYAITAASPVLAFHRRIQPGAPAQPGEELLASERFVMAADPVEHDGSEEREKYVTGSFVAGVAYRGKVIVTNSSPALRRVQVLTQIPRGALPLAGSRVTDSRRLALPPFTTQTVEYAFYFPAAAAEPFVHYPAHLSQEGRTIGAAKATTFAVVAKPPQADRASWQYVSQYGTEDEVVAFLEKANLHRLELEKVAWRARASVAFFRRLTTLLAARHVYRDALWRYAVVHRERAALAEWLRHQGAFIAECGPALVSPLLRIDPVERRSWEHLEYSPLVNQRIHRLGGEANVVNPAVRAQYQELLHILAHKPALDAMDHATVAYHLFLQDRVPEALARLGQVPADSVPTAIQLDYLRAYAALYEERLPEARALAAKYAAYPVPRWQRLFAEVTAQIAEIDARQAERPAGGPPDREAQQAALSGGEPSFDFRVEERRILVNWRNLGEATLAFYPMDAELMFSSSPFSAQGITSFTIVKPLKTARVVLPPGQETLEVPLPAEYHQSNVLVEITAGGQRKAQAHHASNLRLLVTENFGLLDTRDAATGKPVSRAYVKVYARLKSGSIRFYKDGYTDLRGRFDYASLNSGNTTEEEPPIPADKSTGGFDHPQLSPAEMDRIDRLAILVVSDTHGAAVREATPPAR